MKKTTMLAAVAAVCLCSCSGSSKGNAPEADSLNIEEVATLDEAVDIAVENVVKDLNKTLESGDTETLKAEVEKINEKIVNLVQEGDADKAIEYASQVKKFAEDNMEKLEKLQKEGGMTIQELVDAVKALPNAVEETAKEAGKAVEADVNTAKEATKAAAKAAADEAVKEAQEKTNEQVEEAQKKANEKVQEATQKAAQKAADAINKAAEKLKNQNK